MRSASLSIFCLQTLHEERFDFAGSTLYGKSMDIAARTRGVAQISALWAAKAAVVPSGQAASGALGAPRDIDLCLGRQRQKCERGPVGPAATIR